MCLTLTCGPPDHHHSKNLNMHRLGVLNRVVGDLDGAFIVAEEGHHLTVDAIVLEGFLHP